MIEALNKFWGRHLGAFEPLAHELKHVFKDRWVRFHALPESKRYPEDESEYREIFLRHNSILADLNGVNNDLLIVLPEYVESKVPGRPAEELGEILPESEYWYTLNQLEECGAYWHLHVSRVRSSSDQLNSIFRLVADDQIRNIIVISLASESVFHPYDGGVDIVLRSTEERDLLKKKYQGWLSKHHEGY